MLPFNIASYALLTHIIAAECNYEVGELVYSGADVHIYNNHIDAAKEVLNRKTYKLPTLKFNTKCINDYTIDDFTLLNYKHGSKINAPLS